MTFIEKIVDVQTGETTERVFTKEETAKVEAKIAANKAEADAVAEKETAKADLLAKLGISADEAKLLLS